jgi:hypothetical protein
MAIVQGHSTTDSRPRRDRHQADAHHLLTCEDDPGPGRSRQFGSDPNQPQAEARVAAAIAAGGHLVTDQYAPAWWVLADAEGNDACVATWMGSD